MVGSFDPTKLSLFWGAKQMIGTRIGDRGYSNTFCRREDLEIGNHLHFVPRKEDKILKQHDFE